MLVISSINGNSGASPPANLALGSMTTSKLTTPLVTESRFGDSGRYGNFG